MRPCISMRRCSDSRTGHARRSISRAPGSTAAAIPCHLNDISQTGKQQRSDSGVIDHVAFSCRGFEATKQHLSENGVAYHVNQVPNSARWQIFLRDPNNVEIELNFESKNEIGE
jgi:4-hydroxyphenylpyruvate dioxygenase-like putative hemolysin